jgi:hypothetical protein
MNINDIIKAIRDNRIVITDHADEEAKKIARHVKS